MTAVGDPNQAIYGWRGASVSNILDFAETFPARRGDGADVPADGQPALRPRGSSRSPTGWPRRSTPRTTPVAPLEPKPEAGRGRRSPTAVYETHRDELAALVDGVREAHAGAGTERWSEHRRAHPRQRPRRRGLRRADRAPASRSRSSASPACCACPRSPRSSATLHLMHDVTANAALLTLLTGPRWAIGPRDLELLGGRAARAGRPPRPRRATRRRSTTTSSQIADGIDPAEIPCLDDALDDPGEAPYSPGGAGAVRAARRRAADAALPRRRAAARHRAPDHRHHRRRRRARLGGQPGRRRRAATTSTCSSARSPTSRPSTATSRCRRCWPTSPPRTTRATASTSPPRPRPTRSSCSPSTAPRAWSGTAVFLVGVCETRFPANRSRTLWTSSPAVLPAPLRGDADDLPQLRGHDKAALDAYRADTQAHDADRGAAARATSPSPAPRTRCRSRRTAGARAPTPFGPSAYQAGRPRPARASGASPSRRGSTSPAKGDPNPYAGEDPSRAVAADRHRRRGAAPARGRRRARARRRPGRRGRRPRHGRERPRRRLGRRGRAAPRRGARRAQRRDRRAAARVSLSASAVLRLREDADAFARELARPMPRPPSPRRPVRHAVPRLGRGRASRSSRCSTPTTCPAAPTSTSPTTHDLDAVIAAFEAGPVRRPRPARGRGVVRARPRRPGGPRPHRRGLPRARRRRSSSSTGRPTAPPPPTRSSSRSTGSPGPSCAACRSSRSGRRSTTCAPASGRAADDLPDRQALEAILGGLSVLRVEPVRDPARGDPAGPVGADRAGRRAVADELHPRVGDGGRAVELDAAVRRAQAQGREVADRRAEAGRPQDRRRPATLEPSGIRTPSGSTAANIGCRS